jgi:hypothetical protein
MFQIALLIFAVLLVVGLGIMLLITVFVALLTACAVGIPLWFLARWWQRNRTISAPAQSPLDRLKTLYVEGKIDLFEFEQRLAHLIAVDR